MHNDTTAMYIMLYICMYIYFSYGYVAMYNVLFLFTDYDTVSSFKHKKRKIDIKGNSYIIFSMLKIFQGSVYMSTQL